MDLTDRLPLLRPATWLRAFGRRLAAPLRRAYIAFDRFNCWRYGVWEFDRADACVIRLSSERSPRALRLADGTDIRHGDRLLRLHYWNEHIPPKDDTPSVAWAARFGARLRASLRAAGQHLRTRDDLSDVVAVVAETSVLSADDVRRVTHFYASLGFEVEMKALDSFRARLHQALRNAHVWLLIWAVNPSSLRRRSPAGVQRIQLRMSRARFLARWGAGEQRPI